MKTLLIWSLIPFFISSVFSQSNYLKQNRQELNENTNLMLDSVKIIGFGAFHGSSNTEIVEINLIESIINSNNTLNYYPETDFSTAHFFENYLENGDETLLKDLVFEYSKRVPQEGSIEYFEKWKKLRKLNQKQKIHIIGIDKIASYKYTIKHLINILKPNNWNYIDTLRAILNNKKSIYESYFDSDTKKSLISFVNAYELKKSELTINDTSEFNHIISNLKVTFSKNQRENQIFQNYIKLYRKQKSDNRIQFIRFGVFHILKNRINGNSSFFSMLIENKIYKTHEIKSIQGFLTKSQVLWSTKYSKKNEYINYKTKAGYGIGDYFLEYFKGIKHLKKNSYTNLTYFNLTNQNSPYTKPNDFQLIIVKKIFQNSQWKPVMNLSTTSYIDAAILIKKSKASIPIEELNNFN